MAFGFVSPWINVGVVALSASQCCVVLVYWCSGGNLMERKERALFGLLGLGYYPDAPLGFPPSLPL